MVRLFAVLPKPTTDVAYTFVVIKVRVFGCSYEGDPRAKADASGFPAGLRRGGDAADLSKEGQGWKHADFGYLEVGRGTSWCLAAIALLLF